MGDDAGEREGGRISKRRKGGMQQMRVDGGWEKEGRRKVRELVGYLNKKLGKIQQARTGVHLVTARFLTGYLFEGVQMVMPDGVGRRPMNRPMNRPINM